jgi:Protein of unknown function (DUF664)
MAATATSSLAGAMARQSCVVMIELWPQPLADDLDGDAVLQEPGGVGATEVGPTLASLPIEETARHAGHLDIARELLDGQTGLRVRTPRPRELSA